MLALRRDSLVLLYWGRWRLGALPTAWKRWEKWRQRGRVRVRFCRYMSPRARPACVRAQHLVAEASRGPHLRRSRAPSPSNCSEQDQDHLDESWRRAVVDIDQLAGDDDTGNLIGTLKFHETPPGGRRLVPGTERICVKATPSSQCASTQHFICIRDIFLSFCCVAADRAKGRVMAEIDPIPRSLFGSSSSSTHGTPYEHLKVGSDHEKSMSENYGKNPICT